MLISAYKLSKNFGFKPLFSDITFTVEEGDRIGLIGPNGAGKSTLLKILSGEIPPTSGDLSRKQGLRASRLEQSPTFTPGATIFESIIEGCIDPHDWESQALAYEYISKLHLNDFPDETKVETLSGGWKKRVALARELVKKPDVLLLDEPTNHMDMESIAWLEDFLSNAPFAIVTITHDRLFLQRISNRIIEIDPRHAGGLLTIDGDYIKYTEVREQLILAQENRETVLKNTLRRETQWLRQGAKARTTKQQARIKKAGDLKDEVEALSERNVQRTARLQFVQSERNPKTLIEAKNVSKSYGDQVIFSNLDLLLTPGSRLGILGRNGAGKSTLIRTLMGHEEPTSGKITRTDQLRVAYFDQTREALNPEETLMKTLSPDGDFVEFNGQSVHIRSYLDRFLFTPQQMQMKVGNMSGGEQSRLLVARLMLKPANVLVLDEPTNDLDIATLSVLEECLVNFNGAIILVTHDRYFLDQVANQLIAFPPMEAKDKRLVAFASFSQWEEWQPEIEVEEKKSQTTSEKKKDKLSYNEQYELDNMESTIHQKEADLEKLSLESSKPENASNASKLTELTTQLAQTQTEIDRLYARWTELEAKKNGKKLD
jgi:ATP-binding cassette subfamily F protein uup